MMTSVSGERGVGKTYHLAKEVYEHYKQNFLTITNFTHVYSNINVSKKQEMLFEIIRELGKFKKLGYELCDLLPTFKHTGVYFAIDEAHLYFGADQWKRYQSDDNFQFIIQFLSQARKQDVEIWYSTQDPSKIDKNWRRYTEDWVRYVPIFKAKKKVLVPHPTRPIMRAEIRYSLPIFWEEHHQLDHSNPEFNWKKTVDSEGRESASSGNTLRWRKMRLSGWLDPFPYKLYDSHEMIGLNEDGGDEKFDLLKTVSIVPHKFKREKFPTFKKMFHIKRSDEQVPTRIKFKEIVLPSPASLHQENIIQQPEEFVSNVTRFNNEKLHNMSKREAEEKLDFKNWVHKYE